MVTLNCYVLSHWLLSFAGVQTVHGLIDETLPLPASRELDKMNLPFE